MGRDSRQLGNNEQSDKCYTPKDAMTNLFPFLDPSLTYYEATSGESTTIIEALTEGGFSVVGSGDKDFFDCGEGDIHDGVVTNPPYSKKDKFIEHCYDLGKPFALLLPVAAFQGQKRGALFKRYGINALVYNRRVDFTGKGSPTFGCCFLMGNGFTDNYKGKEAGKLWFV
tara:strand:+ start:425 stop:934 length:510 start_codon:yes stop_codon:yes gene_type:complete